MTAVMVVAPLSFALAPCYWQGLSLPPLPLDELEGLELVLLEAVVLVAVGTAHHSVAG